MLKSLVPDPNDPFRRILSLGLCVLAILAGLGLAYTVASRLFPVQKLEPVDAHLKREQDASEPPGAHLVSGPEVSLTAALQPTFAISPATRGMSAVTAAGPAANGSPAKTAPRAAGSGTVLAPTAPQAASNHSAALPGGGSSAHAADPGSSAAFPTAAPAGSEGESSPGQAARGDASAAAAEAAGDSSQRAPTSAKTLAGKSGPAQALQPFPASYRGGVLSQPVSAQAASARPPQNAVPMPPNEMAASPPPANASDVVQTALQASASLQAKGAYLAANSGLCPAVALAWVVKENGVNNNILGVTGSSGLNTYATWQQGLDAAISLLQTSSDYRAITAAIANHDCCAQRDAIVASPWSGSSHYGDGANFPSVQGCPPYGQ